MIKRFGKYLLIGFLLVIVVLMAADVGRRSTAPAEHVANDRSTAAASTSATLTSPTWQHFYQLDFSGYQLTPTAVTYDETNNRLALLDNHTQLIFVLEQNSKRFTTLPLPGGRATATIFFASGDLYAFADALWQYDEQAATWQALTPDLQFETPILLADKFDRNFYLVGKQLVRKLVFSEDGIYLGIESWLSSNVAAPLAPTDLLINGYLYLAQADGQITRYLRGQEAKWTNPAELTGPVYLQSSAEQLYLLAPATATIYQTDQLGTVSGRWTDDLLLGATAFWLQTVDQQLNFFILIDQDIYQLSLPLTTP